MFGGAPARYAGHPHAEGDWDLPCGLMGDEAHMVTSIGLSRAGLRVGGFLCAAMVLGGVLGCACGGREDGGGGPAMWRGEVAATLPAGAFGRVHAAAIEQAVRQRDGVASWYRRELVELTPVAVDSAQWQELRVERYGVRLPRAMADRISVGERSEGRGPTVVGVSGEGRERVSIAVFFGWPSDVVQGFPELALRELRHAAETPEEVAEVGRAAEAVGRMSDEAKYVAVMTTDVRKVLLDERAEMTEIALALAAVRAMPPYNAAPYNALYRVKAGEFTVYVMPMVAHTEPALKGFFLVELSVFDRQGKLVAVMQGESKWLAELIGIAGTLRVPE